MILCRFSHQSVPDLLEPLLVFFLSESGCVPLLICRLTIPPRFAKHQDELYVIFNNGIGLVGLAEKARPVFDLVIGIGDFVPKNRTEVVEANLPGPNHDIGVHRHN